MATTSPGFSDAARMLTRTHKQIQARCDSAVTFSRNEVIAAVIAAWEETNEDWKVAPDEVAVTVEVRETAVRFIKNLPLGFPLPEVTREPDGQINLEWYRSPCRIVSVSVAPNNRLYWAALIGTESPRGNSWYQDRIPFFIIELIGRIFEGD